MTVVLRLRANDGFTLIELMIAALLIMVGLVALFGMLDSTAKVTLLTRAREGAVTLAREISEDAHAITYDQITPATISSTLQGMPGMASSASGSWQVVRRGTTYTITASECSVDDPKDGYGVHDSTFCADSTNTGTTDTQPLDFKRLTVTISWNAGTTTHSYSETTTLSSAGQATALTTSNLALASPSPSAPGMSGTATQPTVTSSANNGLTFSVTAAAGTTGIVWTVNGSVQSFSSAQNGTTWTSSTWDISTLSDGTYTVGAAAQDASGVIGPAVTIPVRLVRNVPTAPNVSGYGYNAGLQVSGAATTGAELQWQKNPELNVTGYRVYNPSGTLICTTTASPAGASCGANAWCWTATLVNCVDLAPPASTGANLTYGVAALYYDAANNLQQGPVRQVTLAGANASAFSFATTTANTGSNCAGSSALYDMTGGTLSGSDSLLGGAVSFCSAAYASGQQVPVGGTAKVWIANTGSGACSVTGTWSIDGTSNSSSASVTVPASSAVAKYTFSFAGSGVLNLGAGDRIVLTFTPSGSGCSAVTHVGSATYPSGFSSAGTSIAAPSAVPSVSVSAGTGSATITWTPVTSTTTPVSFYRIYRDSSNYTGRYDTVDPATCSSTCSYFDKNHAASHSYWVTAVGGTTPGSNMRESTPTGPATG